MTILVRTVASVAWLISCNTSSRDFTATDEEIASYAADISSRLRPAGNNPRDVVCGVDNQEMNRQALVVAVSARTCLTCDQVGFTLRALRRDAERRGSVLSVVFPAADSVAVCRFLTDEKLMAGTLLRMVPSLPWRPEIFRGYLRFFRDSAGVPTDPRLTRRSMELLDDTLPDAPVDSSSASDVQPGGGDGSV